MFTLYTRCPVCWQRLGVEDAWHKAPKEGQLPKLTWDPDWVIAEHIRRLHP